MRILLSRRESLQAMVTACVAPFLGGRPLEATQRGADAAVNGNPLSIEDRVITDPEVTRYVCDNQARLLCVIAPESHQKTSSTY